MTDCTSRRARSPALRARVALLLALGMGCGAPDVGAVPVALTTEQWTAQFDREVDHRLTVPDVDQARYVVLLKQALAGAKLDAPAQVVLLIDRSPRCKPRSSSCTPVTTSGA
jgi:hypothetical protein